MDLKLLLGDIQLGQEGAELLKVNVDASGLSILANIGVELGSEGERVLGDA